MWTKLFTSHSYLEVHRFTTNNWSWRLELVIFILWGLTQTSHLGRSRSYSLWSQPTEWIITQKYFLVQLWAHMFLGLDPATPWQGPGLLLVPRQLTGAAACARCRAGGGDGVVGGPGRAQANYQCQSRGRIDVAPTKTNSHQRPRGLLLLLRSMAITAPPLSSPLVELNKEEANTPSLSAVIRLTMMYPSYLLWVVIVLSVFYWLLCLWRVRGVHW